MSHEKNESDDNGKNSEDERKDVEGPNKRAIVTIDPNKQLSIVKRLTAAEEKKKEKDEKELYTYRTLNQPRFSEGLSLSEIRQNLKVTESDPLLTNVYTLESGSKLRLWMVVEVLDPSNVRPPVAIRKLMESPNHVIANASVCKYDTPKDKLNLKECQKIDKANAFAYMRTCTMLKVMNLIIKNTGCGSSCGRIINPTQPEIYADKVVVEIKAVEGNTPKEIITNVIEYLANAKLYAIRDYKISQQRELADAIAFFKEITRKIKEIRKTRNKVSFRAPGHSPSTWDGKSVKDDQGVELCWGTTDVHTFYHPDIEPFAKNNNDPFRMPTLYSDENTTVDHKLKEEPHKGYKEKAVQIYGNAMLDLSGASQKAVVDFCCGAKPDLEHPLIRYLKTHHSALLIEDEKAQMLELIDPISAPNTEIVESASSNTTSTSSNIISASLSTTSAPSSTVPAPSSTISPAKLESQERDFGYSNVEDGEYVFSGKKISQDEKEAIERLNGPQYVNLQGQMGYGMEQLKVSKDQISRLMSKYASGPNEIVPSMCGESVETFDYRPMEFMQRSQDPVTSTQQILKEMGKKIAK